MMSGIGKETEEPKDIKPIKLYYNSTLSYAEYVAFISNTGVRVAQLEEAWTVNHAVGRSSPSSVKF